MAAVANIDGQMDLFRQPFRSGRKAFGYEPEGWPSAKSFLMPISPLQVKMVGAKTRERDVAMEELAYIRALVLQHYGVGDGNSKGNASLLIDFLMNAPDEALDAAVHAARSYEDSSYMRSVFVA